jgi:predicted methyltransferase
VGLRPKSGGENSGAWGYYFSRTFRLEKSMLSKYVLCALCGLIAASAVSVAAQEKARNVWEEQYRARSAAEMAAQFESPTRPIYRHRADIVELLQLKPGMSVAEIGAGSGFLSLLMAEKVLPSGKVVATELDEKMVSFMNARARTHRLTNFNAMRGQTTSTGLAPASMDAITLVNTYSFFDRPDAMLRSIKKSLKPGGLLLIVDFPRAGQGNQIEGVSPADVIAAVTKAGFEYLDNSAVVPGHYALRFRSVIR